MRCREPFGKYLATGITCLVAGQAVVNLGAVLGFLPLTGVPLPLISSGGSSLVVFMTMAGILLNIAQSGTPPRRPAARRGRTLPDDDAPKPKPAQVKRLRTATAASADSRRRNSRPRRTRAGSGSRARG
jgi:cell division protein FtsW